MTETFVVDAPTIPLPAPWCWVWYTRHPRGMKRRRSITEYQAEKLKLQADLDAFARLYHRLDSQMRTRLYRTIAEDAADQGLAIAPTIPLPAPWCWVWYTRHSTWAAAVTTPDVDAYVYVRDGTVEIPNRVADADVVLAVLRANGLVPATTPAAVIWGTAEAVMKAVAEFRPTEDDGWAKLTATVAAIVRAAIASS